MTLIQHTTQEILDAALQLFASRPAVLAVLGSVGELTGYRGLDERHAFLRVLVDLGRTGPRSARQTLRGTNAKQLIILAGDETAQVFDDERLQASLVVLYGAGATYVKNLGRDVRQRFFKPLAARERG